MLYEKLAELKICEENIKKYLPEKLVPHCKISSISRGILTITAVNTGILSLLRYEKSALLKKLRTDEKMYDLKNIDLKLADPSFRAYHIPNPLPIKSIQFSQKSCESVQAAAADCTYEPLKKALEQLEKTLQEKSRNSGWDARIRT